MKITSKPILSSKLFNLQHSIKCYFILITLNLRKDILTKLQVYSQVNKYFQQFEIN
jgi:hypothetical protein